MRGPRTSFGRPVFSGAGTLAEHATGPVTVLAASWTPPVLPVRTTAPVTVLAVQPGPPKRTVPVVRLMTSGPVRLDPHTWTAAARSDWSGPSSVEPVRTRAAPARTVTGPRRAARSTQVTPSVTVSGPLRTPVIFVVHAGARPTAALYASDSASFPGLASVRGLLSLANSPPVSFLPPFHSAIRPSCPAVFPSSTTASASSAAIDFEALLTRSR